MVKGMARMAIRSVGTALAVLALAVAATTGCATVGAPGGSAGQPATATIEYTDDAGRQVRLPAAIERIAPSGPMAQLVLFALCPDKLVGLASDFNNEQFRYIDRKYASLPVFGSFYGSGLNLEAVMKARPQVIIDVGDATGTAVADLDAVQAKTGVPTVFVSSSMGALASTFEKLGDITGDRAPAAELADYVSRTLADITQKVASVPASARPTVYYGQDNGLTAVVGGTTHGAAIDAVGATNVVHSAGAGRSGTVLVSMEQLMLWNPQIILFAPGSAKNAAGSQWQGLSAVAAHRYYEIPSGPYNWLDQPPSVNQIIGAVWLANLLYPQVFQYDMTQQAQRFYRLFYHCELSDAQARALLAGSTPAR